MYSAAFFRWWFGGWDERIQGGEGSGAGFPGCFVPGRWIYENAGKRMEWRIHILYIELDIYIYHYTSYFVWLLTWWNSSILSSNRYQSGLSHCFTVGRKFLVELCALQLRQQGYFWNESKPKDVHRQIFRCRNATPVEHHNAQYTHQHHYVPHFFYTTLFWWLWWAKLDAGGRRTTCLWTTTTHGTLTAWCCTKTGFCGCYQWRVCQSWNGGQAADFSYGGLCIG